MAVTREQVRGWYQVATSRVNAKNISTEYYFELAMELVDIVISQIKAHPVAALAIPSDDTALREYGAKLVDFAYQEGMLCKADYLLLRDKASKG